MSTVFVRPFLPWFLFGSSFTSMLFDTFNATVTYSMVTQLDIKVVLGPLIRTSYVSDFSTAEGWGFVEGMGGRRRVLWWCV